MEDQAASERYLQCIYGLFSNPIHGNGDYPEVLKKRMSHICSTLGLPSSSLPDFTEEEILQNKGDPLPVRTFYGREYKVIVE